MSVLRAIDSLLLGDGFRFIGEPPGRRGVRVHEAVRALARAQLLQCRMEERQLALGQRVRNVSQLVRVDPHVVVRDETRDEFAVERVVRGVQRPQAPVRVVVRVHADAERAVRPEGGRPPVVVVVAEAVHLLVVALSVVRLGHGSLAVQLLLSPLHALLFDLAPVSLPGEPLFRPGARPRPVHVHARAQRLSVGPVFQTETQKRRMIVISIALSLSLSLAHKNYHF